MWENSRWNILAIMKTMDKVWLLISLRLKLMKINFDIHKDISDEHR